MTVDDMHQIVSLIQNKGQSRYFTPEQIDYALNTASDNIYNRETELYEKSRKVSDRLRPYKQDASVSLTVGNGALPSDYDVARFMDAGTVRVDILPDTEWAFRVASLVAPPSASFPIALINQDVEVRPTSITTVTLYYFKVPVEMEWAYTLSGSRPIYDSGSSTQPDWPESVHAEIVEEACTYLGLSLKDEPLTQLRQYQETK